MLTLFHVGGCNHGYKDTRPEEIVTVVNEDDQVWTARKEGGGNLYKNTRREVADNVDNNAYLFTPDGLTQNPTITLYRGITYKFDIDTQLYVLNENL